MARKKQAPARPGFRLSSRARPTTLPLIPPGDASRPIHRVVPLPDDHVRLRRSLPHCARAASRPSSPALLVPAHLSALPRTTRAPGMGAFIVSPHPLRLRPPLVTTARVGFNTSRLPTTQCARRPRRHRCARHPKMCPARSTSDRWTELVCLTQTVGYQMLRDPGAGSERDRWAVQEEAAQSQRWLL